MIIFKKTINSYEFMEKTEARKLSGILEEVIMLEGKFGREVGVKVAGQDFLKRFWRKDEISPKKREKLKSFSDILSQEEFNYKKEFTEEHSSHIGEVVRVEFKEVSVNLFRYVIDQLVGPRYPRRYMEIISLSYQRE